MRLIGRSPFTLMPIWIVAACLLYALGWSGLLGPMRSDTILFLAIVSFCYLILAQRKSIDDELQGSHSLNPAALALITVYFAGAYLENGGIPLLQLLSGSDYDVYGFGIDGLHIAMLCFTGFYAVRAFRRYLDTRRILDGAAFVWPAILLATIANRSAVSFLAFSCALVFILTRKLSAAWVVALVMAGLVFAFGFGVFGDIRLAHQIEAATGVPAERDAILQFARASEAFSASGLSPSWLWSYTYFVSPLANLNSAFALSGSNLCGQTCDVSGLLFYELMPDVIGNRAATLFGMEPVDPSSFLVAHDVTATTMFGSAVAEAGVLGGLGVAAALAALAILAIRGFRKRAYAVEGYAILGTMIFFGFFENMVAYSALCGQLVLVVVLSQIRRFWSRDGSRRR